MKLIIGGCGQGKLRYVCDTYECEPKLIYDSCLPELDKEVCLEVVVVNHFHQYVRDIVQHADQSTLNVKELLEKYPNCVIISDEVGNGIVPMDAFERKYRDCLGNLLIELAKSADEVVRVICGLGQKIK